MAKATPDWVSMDKQLKQLQLETEMDAMEAALMNAAQAPILNFDLMQGFEPPEQQKIAKEEQAAPLALHEI